MAVPEASAETNARDRVAVTATGRALELPRVHVGASGGDTRGPPKQRLHRVPELGRAHTHARVIGIARVGAPARAPESAPLGGAGRCRGGPFKARRGAGLGGAHVGR